VLALMIRCDNRDLVLLNSDHSDLRTDWSQINLSRDAWVAMDSKGGIRGYGAVLPWGTGKRLVIYDDPGTEQADMFLGLLMLCEGRAVNQLMERPFNNGCDLVTCISNSASGQKAILEKGGYQILRNLFNMQRELNDDLNISKLPESVLIRPTVPEQDIWSIYNLVQAAFDWRDRQVQPFEEWQAFMLRVDSFDPELWFLAEASGEIIGACLCFPFDGMGWVRQFAVRKDWRKQGIGRALLMHAFQAFKQRHYQKAGLAVEDENPEACRFYEKMGMTKAVHLMEYVKMAKADADDGKTGWNLECPACQSDDNS